MKSNEDYAGLCLLGSKECARIADLVYVDHDTNRTLELAHHMFAILSFIEALAPMFFMNAWIGPQSSRYKVAIRQNGF